MSKQFIAILVVIVGGLFAIVAFNNNKNSTSSNNGGSSSSAQPSSHVTGKTDSKVKLVEYGDYQCPACGQYHPIFKQLIEEYKDKVAFQFANFPLTQIHQNAYISARAAEAAGKQNKFWEMHDLLYENQTAWSSVSDPSETFVGYAKQLNLNESQFRTDMNSSAVSDMINADRQVIQNMGATGTPTFVLNGKKLDKSPTSLDEFKKLLDQELAKIK